MQEIARALRESGVTVTTITCSRNS